MNKPVYRDFYVHKSHNCRRQQKTLEIPLRSQHRAMIKSLFNVTQPPRHIFMVLAPRQHPAPHTHTNNTDSMEDSGGGPLRMVSLKTSKLCDVPDHTLPQNTTTKHYILKKSLVGWRWSFLVDRFGGGRISIFRWKIAKTNVSVCGWEVQRPNGITRQVKLAMVAAERTRTWSAAHRGPFTTWISVRCACDTRNPEGLLHRCFVKEWLHQMEEKLKKDAENANTGRPLLSSLLYIIITQQMPKIFT